MDQRLDEFICEVPALVFGAICKHLTFKEFIALASISKRARHGACKRHELWMSYNRVVLGEPPPEYTDIDKSAQRRCSLDLCTGCGNFFLDWLRNHGRIRCTFQGPYGVKVVKTKSPPIPQPNHTGINPYTPPSCCDDRFCYGIHNEEFFKMTMATTTAGGFLNWVVSESTCSTIKYAHENAKHSKSNMLALVVGLFQGHGAGYQQNEVKLFCDCQNYCSWELLEHHPNSAFAYTVIVATRDGNIHLFHCNCKGAVKCHDIINSPKNAPEAHVDVSLQCCNGRHCIVADFPYGVYIYEFFLPRGESDHRIDVTQKPVFFTSDPCKFAIDKHMVIGHYSVNSCVVKFTDIFKGYSGDYRTRHVATGICNVLVLGKTLWVLVISDYIVLVRVRIVGEKLTIYKGGTLNGHTSIIRGYGHNNTGILASMDVSATLIIWDLLKPCKIRSISLDTIPTSMHVRSRKGNAAMHNMDSSHKITGHCTIHVTSKCLQIILHRPPLLLQLAF